MAGTELGILRASRWVRGLGPHLRGPARALLLALASHANGDLTAWPSDRTMAAEAGISRSTVQQLLPQLVDHKVLEVAAAQRGTLATRYRFTLRDYTGLPKRLDNDHPTVALRADACGPATRPQDHPTDRPSGPATGPQAAPQDPTSGPATRPQGQPASGPATEPSGPATEPSGPATGPEVPEGPEGTTTGGAVGLGEWVDRSGAGQPPKGAGALRSGGLPVGIREGLAAALGPAPGAWPPGKRAEIEAELAQRRQAKAIQSPLVAAQPTPPPEAPARSADAVPDPVADAVPDPVAADA